jgi:tight adherence protein C
MIGREVLAALLAGVAVASLAGIIVRPVGRLGPRVRPYVAASRSALGVRPDVMVGTLPGGPPSSGVIRRLFWPPIERLSRALGRLVDREAGEEQLLIKLRRAGLFPTVPVERRIQEYRVRQLGAAVLGAAAGTAATALLGRSPLVVLVAGLLGFGAGATRWRSRVDRAMERRRERMGIELYTVNQLLAMHLRAGGGVMQAVRQIENRGRGTVIEELGEILRAVQAGVAPAAALERQATLTVEPAAARTYRVLGSGVEHGADLATALLELSEDVRDARREGMRRAATRRRAAMLVPIICVLAPVMLLFVAAPLPSLIFGGL